MKKNSKKSAYRFGVDAERIASWYLRLKCYRVLAMRYRNGGGEIDIVAAKGRTLIAVEVKARRNFKECEETVMPWKQQKIARAMEGLIAGHKPICGLVQAHTRDIRFDVIWIVRGKWPKHIKDAWRM